MTSEKAFNQAHNRLMMELSVPLQNELEALLAAAVKKGAEDMRERAAEECERWTDIFEEAQARSDGKQRYAVDSLPDVADAIRALPLIEEPDQQA